MIFKKKFNFIINIIYINIRKLNNNYKIIKLIIYIN